MNQMKTKTNVNRLLKKVFLFIIKYMPITQMVGMLINNTLFYFDIVTKAYYLFNYLTGNSLITISLLYVCS